MSSSATPRPAVGVEQAVGAVLVFCLTLGLAPPAWSETELPTYLRDRGEGLPTSLFGTYVREKELLVYAFYEYTLNRDQEYKPEELGFNLDRDFRAKRTDHEALLFVSYGLARSVAFELESAVFTTATQRKATDDPSGMPTRFKESGLGDTEGQIRWRWTSETERRPELFSFFEFVFPLQKNRVLIGTSEWELAQGFGAIKGSRWGTFTGRVSASYSGGDGTVEFGEWDVEYLKRTSRLWRWVLSLEGEQDELALIAEGQLQLRPGLLLKLNSGFGVTDKAPDLAPEVGVVFSFR